MGLVKGNFLALGYTERMRPPLIAVVAIALLLTGCVATPSPSPSDTQGAPAPSSTPSSTPTSPPLSDGFNPPSEYGAFGTASELANICFEIAAPSLQPAVVHVENAHVARRTILPEWLVYIPAANQNGDFGVVCILGGTPDDLETYYVGAGISSLEEVLERDLSSNAYFGDFPPR